MKPLTKILLAAFVAATAQLASAVNYSAGDLLLVFRDGANPDVVYDIGPATNYTGLAAGTVTTVSYDKNLVSANFGSFAGVTFGVVGENDASAKVWLSDADLTTTPGTLTPNTYATLQAEINEVGVIASLITSNTASPLVITTSDPNSYSSIVSPGDAGDVATFGGDAPFVVTTANPAQVLLYEMIPNTSTTFRGTFKMTSDGTIVYTAGISPLITGFSSPGVTTRGSNATFSVTALNTTGYQWYFNGVAIAGATNSSLTVSNVQPGNIGNYSVVATNRTDGSSTANFSPASLVVSPGYLPTDALLVFHDGINSDMLFNLGSISNFITQASNTTKPISYNQAAVLANFGSLAGVQVSLVAEADALSTVWLSDADASSTPTDVTPNTYATLQGKIDFVGTAASGIETNVLDYNNPLILNPSDPNSYSSIVSPGDPANVDSFGGDAPFNVGGDISASGLVTFRLFALHPTVGVPSPEAALGFVSLAAGGSNVTFTVDGTAPTVTILLPKANAKVAGTNNANAIVVNGTAKDNFLIAEVQYSFNGSPFASATLANGTNWSVANLSFVPGTNNTIMVKSIDADGNVSVVTNRSFVYSAYSTLTILTNGSGTVTPNLSGQNLLYGKAYNFTAKPGVGFLPSNWVGVVNGATNVVSSGGAVKYTYVPGLFPDTLIASFVTNRFFAVTGSYNGLFMNSNGVVYDSAGLASIKVTDKDGKPAAYTAKLSVSGENVTTHGTFDLNGNSITVKSAAFKNTLNTNTLTVQLHLPLNGSEIISGSVSNSDGTLSDLSADLAQVVTNFDGNYTMIVPGSTNAETSPAGDGFGLVFITNGVIKLAGSSLADGAAFAQKVNVSQDGQWPLYVGLYKTTIGGAKVTTGAILGWVTVTNAPEGSLIWIKTSDATNAPYLGGFTNSTDIVGSTYDPSVAATTNVIQLTEGTNGMVILQNGNLVTSITNNVYLSALNKFKAYTTNTAGVTNKMTLAVTTKTGKLSGAFKIGAVTTKFTGAVLQNTNIGRGYFLGTNESGSFLLEGN